MLLMHGVTTKFSFTLVADRSMYMKHMQSQRINFFVSLNTELHVLHEQTCKLRSTYSTLVPGVGRSPIVVRVSVDQ